jgi:hypothetical protein
MAERRVVSWPGAQHGPDVWEDPCWESLDVEGRFPALWAAWRRRHVDPDGFVAAARARSLCAEELDDRNRPDWRYPAPSLDDLIRVTTDTWPAAGMDAPDVVLGPGSLFASRLRRRVAVAGCAFVWTDGWPQSCFHIWCRGKPLPTAEERATLRAVGLAPWALWRVERRASELHLHDWSGLGAAYRPDGPVRVIGEEPTGEGLAARVLFTSDGWVAHCAIDVPVLPTRERVDDHVREETWLARTVQPGITREALLRKRPFLVRRAMEHVAAARL